jgi:ATP-dependent RNA helicase RhlE
VLKNNNNMPFSNLGLSESLLKAIAEQHYTKIFPVQAQAIPAILKRNDILGIAPTGSGKTASFVLPILEILQTSKKSRNRFVNTLVLVPTRELAIQTATAFQEYSKKLPKAIKSLAVFGGVSINPQMINLQGTEILIATPGRLLDLVSSHAVNLSEVKILVLDEADKMLHLGFKEEIDKIFALLPKKRQNILFSATLSHDLNTIRENLLHNPEIIEIKEESPDVDLISQIAYYVGTERKGPFLRYLIKHENMQQVLVFVSSKLTADKVVHKLKMNGIEAAALHSLKSQGSRTISMNLFKSGKLRVLVATDLASRGIDIPFLPYVINYELPRSPKDYIHRIGRTGRAESKGEAISLICIEDIQHFRVIQKKMGKRIDCIATVSINLQGY